MERTTPRPRPRPTPPEPSAYEQVTRRGLDDLQAQVNRMETKLNGVLTAVVGGILLEIYKLAFR
jgi:hypothetical protein